MSKGLMKKITLDTVGGGVCTELFEREVQEIAKNINDQNTSATAKRSITMKFTFSPDGDRRETTVIIEAKSALAPVKAAKNTIYCGRIDGAPVMLGADPDQMELDLQSDETPSLNSRRTEVAGIRRTEVTDGR